MRRPAARSDGFTLVELLVVMAIGSLVVPAIAMALVVYSRTAFVASTRADRAHASQSLAATLQADLASATEDPTANRQPCDPLTLQWMQPNPQVNGVAGTPTTYLTTYTTVAKSGSDGPFVLQRTLTVTGASPVTTTVAYNLPSACAATFSRVGDSMTATISFSSTGDGVESTITTITGALRARVS
jgi:prepilin-type N-terminal cleavage/methylation domain-containing protein